MKKIVLLTLYCLRLIAGTKSKEVLPHEFSQDITTREKYPPGSILEVTGNMRDDSVFMFSNDILVVDHVKENETIIAHTKKNKVEIPKTDFHKIRILSDFNIGDKIVHRNPLLGQWKDGTITELNPLTVDLNVEFLGRSMSTRDVIVWRSIRKMLTQESLIEAKKLMLLLDLDETIIGSVETDGAVETYDFSFENVYVCLREGWKSFLETMSKKYIIGVYTTAMQSYADTVVRTVDPEGVYITAGVYSSRNGCNRTKKSTKEFNSYFKHEIPDHMIHIVDDKPTVWDAEDQAKVVPISPWNPHKSLDNCEEVTLATVLENLEVFHATFFDE